MNQILQALPAEASVEITPQRAVEWADYKREKQLEIMRLKYDRRAKEREFDSLPVNNLNIPRLTELRKLADDLSEKITYAQIERDHAADMLRINLEFAYWGGESLTLPPSALDELVGTTPAGKEAAKL